MQSMAKSKLSSPQQKKIRDDVTKFEKHLKDNDAKRQRANLKAQTERKLREMKVGGNLREDNVPIHSIE